MSLLTEDARETLDHLMRTEGKAELIGGRVVTFPPTGYRPNVLKGRILRRLAEYCDTTGREDAVTGCSVFAVPELLNGRESFSPDVAYYTGPLPANQMKFVEGPPDFSVEVRSDGDYGPAAEAEMAAKRADYFEAGTLVVWDVDPVARVVRSYRSDGSVAEFAAGSEADAEPAVPGLRLSVDWLMA